MYYQWPEDLHRLFDTAFVTCVPAIGHTKRTAIEQLLDCAARMSVWQCHGDPGQLESAYFSPYTPIGTLTASGINKVLDSFTIDGSAWGKALNALKNHVVAHAGEIVQAFKDNPLPYKDLLNVV